MVAERHETKSVDAGSILPNPYEFVSIRSVSAPPGAAGTDWYRYEIEQGQNRITGYRQGGITDIRLAVEAIVIQLNERRHQKRGRVHVVLHTPTKPTTSPPI